MSDATIEVPVDDETTIRMTLAQARVLFDALSEIFEAPRVAPKADTTPRIDHRWPPALPTFESWRYLAPTSDGIPR